MKCSIFVLVLIMLFGLIAMGASSTAAAATLGTGFSRALDDDGDGIPNGDDADYVPPLDGTGNKFGATATATVSTSIVLPLRYSWNWFMPFTVGLWIPNTRQLSVAGYGPGDGSGDDGDGPADGTGYGPGPYGTGDCK